MSYGQIIPQSGARPYMASGAITAGMAVCEVAVDATSSQQKVIAGGTSQHATFGSLPQFAGIAGNDAADGASLAVLCLPGSRLIGLAGDVIAARKALTFDATGKLVEYSHDTTKFGIIVGYSLEAASASGKEFSFIYRPMLVGPASASADDLTLTDDLIAGGDIITTGGRMQGKQGADVASANNLVLGADGNAFEITGVTQVNLIANTNWQNGSEITLLFTSTPTVKHAQVTAGANITILLAGAADFVASAGDVLTLMLCEIGGTQAWRETGRSVI